MPTAEPRAALESIAELEERLGRYSSVSVPLLVVRVPSLERMAWQEGLRKARSLEKRTIDAFALAASRVLRAGDLIAHDAKSDVFVAALTSPVRNGSGEPLSIDVRSAVARIAATLEGVIRLEIENGWTTYDARCDAGLMSGAIGRALRQGARERERYAFFSALGHELRTPLSSIRGFLETLLDDEIDQRTRARFLTIAYKESLRLSRLVDGMFEISLLDLNAGTSAGACGDLRDAIGAALDACASSAAARFVDIRCVNIPAIAVAMDVDRIALVAINLIENAVKHGRLGGRITVEGGRQTETMIGVTIDDDGPGIPKSERDALFTLGKRGKTTAPGTGIGLALVRLMLERMGGTILLEDSPLGGARFTMLLPRA